jgi:hypothetical protein
MIKFIKDGGLYLVAYLILGVAAAILDWLTQPLQRLFDPQLQRLHDKMWGYCRIRPVRANNGGEQLRGE